MKQKTGEKKKAFFFSPHCSNDCTLNNLFPPIPHFCPSLTIPQVCFSIFPSAPVPLVIQAMARGIPHSRIGFPSHSALLSIWKHTSPLFLLLPHAAILQLPCREALCPTLWEWQHHCLAEKLSPHCYNLKAHGSADGPRLQPIPTDGIHGER